MSVRPNFHDIIADDAVPSVYAGRVTDAPATHGPTAPTLSRAAGAPAGAAPFEPVVSPTTWPVRAGAAYDVMVVGAGPAGAALASRLAQRHAQRVLVVEPRRAVEGAPWDEHDRHVGRLLDHPCIDVLLGADVDAAVAAYVPGQILFADPFAASVHARAAPADPASPPDLASTLSPARRDDDGLNPRIT